MKYSKIIITSAALAMSACNAQSESDLDAARIENLTSERIFSLDVDEVASGYGEIRISGRPIETPAAVTGCIGDPISCDKGTARSFVLWASDDVLAASDSSVKNIKNGVVDANGLSLNFPFPVQFHQTVTLNITSYFTDVEIKNGWLVLPSSSTFYDDAQAASESPGDVLGEAADGVDVELSPYEERALLAKLPAAKRFRESYRISKDWNAEVVAANQPLAQVQPSEVVNPIAVPQNTSPTNTVPTATTPAPTPTNGSGVANQALDIHDQGATFYCWGYSAFHMLRQYYFTVDSSGAWAQALSQINSYEGMKSYMSDNHPNQGNNMMTWIRKFKAQNPSLPNDGWTHTGSISSAAQKLQQTPAIPSSYCDGRHCTALISFANGSFTVADSSGGYTYQASPSEIGDYSTVSLP